MATMESLAADVKAKALVYLRESGEEIDSFPSSIVDFVIEYSVKNSHFPNYFSDDEMATMLDRCKNTLAMACQEVYNRAGAEGQTSHTEGAISRVYDSAWISGSLKQALPNFVNTPNSLRL